MPKVWKDVLYPGTVTATTPTGERRKVTFTREDMPHYAARLKEMLAADVQVPSCWAHQADSKPMTAQERAALQLADRQRFNFGHGADARVHPDGYVEVEIDVATEEDAARLPGVRYVSPEIVHDFVDGNGRLWPGPSITHIAAVARPVQHRQLPFTARLSLDAVWLALTDYEGDMADEKKGPPADKPADAPPPPPAAPAPSRAAGAGIGPVLEALAGAGIVLPNDTTDANLGDRILVACMALNNAEKKEKTVAPSTPPGQAPKPPGTPAEAAQPVMLSLDKVSERIVTLEREALARRIDALETTRRVPKALAAKLRAEANTVQLSLDQDAKLAPTSLLGKVEAYEDLEPDQTALRFGIDGAGKPREVQPPDGTDDDAEMKAYAKERAAAISRR